MESLKWHDEPIPPLIEEIVVIPKPINSSHPVVLYKEIAEDCYPFSICDKEDEIYMVWQSNKSKKHLKTYALELTTLHI